MGNKRKDRFVVGYKPAKNCIYGKEDAPSNVTPMTRRQAERMLRSLPCKGGAIYELVPVKSDA